MKAIFLDVDGVLNRHSWLGSSIYDERDVIEDIVNKYVTWLNVLPEKPIVVLSSDWRHYREAKERLRKLGVHWEDTTDLWETNRGKLIRRWLSQHPNVTEYVILDDRDDEISLWHKEHFVKVNPKKGLTDENLATAFRTLAFEKGEA